MAASARRVAHNQPSVEFPPDMVKLLSASTYPHSPSHIRKATAGNRQMYGGIIATGTSTEDEEDDQRSRKRSKKNEANALDGDLTVQKVQKRQRGRPKVSSGDADAAERRRTQIRLAQRAYRNRKESTITELTQKVENLQSTIQSIDIGFMRLRESLSNAGLVHAYSPVAEQIDGLMKQLSEARQSFPSDNRRMSEADDSETRNGNCDEGREECPALPDQSLTHPVNSISDNSSSSGWLPGGTDHSMLDYEGQIATDFQSDPVLPINSSYFLASGASQVQLHDHQVSPIEKLALTHIERFPHKNSYTYSFQETTFARRLHRLCIERAFHRLMSPHVDPDWLVRSFRLTFNFSNKERIIQAFKNILARGTDEALENWKTPFVHVGGAGLHFPRRDDNGHAIVPPNMLGASRSAGTWRLPNTETEPPADNLEEILKVVGFDGDWFDCHDVEGYLKTKGIFPEAQSSFVMVDSALINLPQRSQSKLMANISPSSSSSPGSYDTHLTGRVTSAGGSIDVVNNMARANLVDVHLDGASLVDPLIHDWLGQQEPYTPNAFDIELPQPDLEMATGQSRMLTIEVEKFLERLSDQSVCLGRAPGFRREHVDDALVLAMQEAF